MRRSGNSLAEASDTFPDNGPKVYIRAIMDMDMYRIELVSDTSSACLQMTSSHARNRALRLEDDLKNLPLPLRQGIIDKPIPSCAWGARPVEMVESAHGRR